MVERWLQTNGTFRPETEEIVRTPERMLYDLEAQGKIEGDCDCFSTLAAALCKANNWPADLVAIRSDGTNPEFTHVFVECNGDRIDATSSVVLPEVERMVLTV